MDRELALECAENLSKQLLFFGQRKCAYSTSVKNLTVDNRMLITKHIEFQVKGDIASCPQNYKTAKLQITFNSFILN